MERVLKGLLVLVAIIHLLPLSGVLGANRLVALYGISFDDPNLEILMRHRAVLFGLIGFLFIYAVFTPSIRLLAIVTGFISVVSFLLIAWFVGGYNDAIQTVMVADVIALVVLILASTIHMFRRN